MSTNLTATDLFAGAGGSSTGMASVPGIEVVIAANHWPLACEVHNQNHPNTDHAAVDLHKEDPAYFPRTDILWASPECTKWSQANGKARPAIEEGLFEDPLSDDAATRSRLLMFDVLRFAEYHRYRAMIIENVVDIATQAKYRLAWHEWRRQLRALGYRFRVVSLNSMHAKMLGDPAPQSRDRIYIVCWREGERAPDLDQALRPRAYCPKCDRVVESNQAWKNGREVGKYRSQYVYVHGACGTLVEPDWLPAAAAIDWSIPGERIGDRSKPLAEKTQLRIAAGIARYWGPLHIEESGNQYDAADPKHPQHGDPNAYYRAWPTSEYMRTLTTRETRGFVQPPFVAEMYGTSTARPVTEPAGTFTAGGNHHALVTRHYGIPGGDPARHTTPAAEYMRTLTTSGTPSLVQRMNSGGSEMTTPVFEELRTLTTKGHQALIQPGRPRVSVTDLRAARELLPDVLFRMFRPHEVAAGMAFPPDYRWDAVDPEKGRPASNADVTKMAGNAVTPPAARDLAACVVEAITGEAVAA
jgi:DNA (cytosine-5)-methyltransferase 1